MTWDLHKLALDIAEEFAERAARDLTANWGALSVRSNLPRYLSSVRSWLRADHREVAELYRPIKRGRHNWGYIVERNISNLVPPTRCSRGHDMTDENNLLAMRSGRRVCKLCHRELERERANRRRGMRERMKELRAGMTHKFTIITKCLKLKCVSRIPRDHPCSRCGGIGTYEVDGYLTCNTYEDGRLGEIFIRIGKAGNEEAIYEQWAIGASVALQYGVPVEAYFRKFVATQFEPAGATKNEEIKRCTLILDYVAKFILARYVPKTEETGEPPVVAEVQP